MSVQLAILTALASSPDRRATFEEIRRDVASIVSGGGDRTAQAERLSGLGDIDIFESGFVLRDDTGLQITDAGLSLLHWLESSTPNEPLPPISPASEPLESIDDLIGAETRRKFFELELRPQQRDNKPEGHVAPDNRDEDRRHEDTSEPKAPANLDSLAQEARPTRNETLSSAGKRGEVPPTPPDFLPPKFGVGVSLEPARSGFLYQIESLLKRGGKAWRGHLTSDMQRETTSRSNVKAERLLFTFLALLVFISGACVIFALTEVKSAKTELVALQRELLPLKERLARLEQSERNKQALDRPSALKERLAGVDVSAQAPPTPQPPLVLSREEIQVVRDFIKPAPTPGSTMPPIAVGDPVEGPTIPVPSAVSEKVPKLIGARFTIRNGTIVIVRSGSRNAEAVVAQN